MNVIEFKIEPINIVGFESHQVRIVVDGRDYIDITDSIGLHPFILCSQVSLLEGGSLNYSRCTCASEGCGDSYLDVVKQNTTVTWRNQTETDVCFDLEQYQAAIEKIKNDFSWELPADSLQRLASELDYSRFEIAGWKFLYLRFMDFEKTLKVYFVSSSGKHKQHLLSLQEGNTEEYLQILKNWLLIANPEDLQPITSLKEQRTLEEEKARKNSNPHLF